LTPRWKPWPIFVDDKKNELPSETGDFA
jgi:hypothetical protein